VSMRRAPRWHPGARTTCIFAFLKNNNHHANNSGVSQPHAAIASSAATQQQTNSTPKRRLTPALSAAKGCGRRPSARRRPILSESIHSGARTEVWTVGVHASRYWYKRGGSGAASPTRPSRCVLGGTGPPAPPGSKNPNHPI
jgi:hypothetical protein